MAENNGKFTAEFVKMLADFNLNSVEEVIFVVYLGANIFKSVSLVVLFLPLTIGFFKEVFKNS